MGKWEMVRLGDVCNGTVTNIAQKDLADNNGDYPIYGASGFIKNVDFYKQEKPYIAVVKDGAGIGRVSRMPANSSIIGTMQYILPNENIDRDFLYYVMVNLDLARFYTGATIPHIYFKDYKKETIPLPPLPIQQKIADVLDRANALVKKRKAQIEKLDLLVKSQFIEMFGDPVTNPKGWETAGLETVCTKITDGEHMTPKRTTKGVYLLSARNILNHRIDVTDVDYIDESEYERISRRITPSTGDILISCSGSIGRVARITDGTRYQLVRSVAILQLTNEVNSVFVEYCFDTNYMQTQIWKSVNQSSQANLFQGKIRELKIPLPPLALQNQFAAFVERVEAQKARMKKGLELMELEYKSLMQKCFEGEIY